MTKEVNEVMQDDEKRQLMKDPDPAGQRSNAVCHPYLATLRSGPVTGQIVDSNTLQPFVPLEASPCWVCNGTDLPETLFKPCHCSGVVHRACFRKWRQGWINPRNYFNCPNCMTNYNIERISDKEPESEARIKHNYRIQLLKLWVTTFFVIGLFVFAIAGISYGADTSGKDIPVAIKYLMSSVVNGVPKGNETDIWASNFQKADVRVWPYYTLFAIFITSLIVLIGFAAMGCSFSQKDYRSDRRCCADCNCNDNGTCFYCYYINCDCGGCNCGSCNGCSAPSGGDCKCDAPGEAAVILILVVVVAVIISALFVIIFFTLQKSALLYDRYTHMLLSQQEELEGQTIVLGLNETWRPLDAV